MPDEDYVREGFHFLYEHPSLLPKSMPFDVSPAGFRAWRQSGGSMWVLRFEITALSDGIIGAPLVAYTEARRRALLKWVVDNRIGARGIQMSFGAIG
jgi:hypothetical protein